MGSRTDISLFIYGHSATIIFILIYVDDIIVTGPNSSALNSLIYKGVFPIKDMGPLSITF